MCLLTEKSDFVATQTRHDDGSSKGHPKIKVGKLVLPLVGLFMSLIVAVYGLYSINHLPWVRILIGVSYAATFALGMEYVARYQHCFSWHGKKLWFLHATHHHLHNIVYGQGPQDALAAKQKKDDDDNTNNNTGRTNPKMVINRLYQTEDLPFVWEKNDYFPVFFASIAISAILWGFLPPPTLLKDMVFGAFGGVSMYGTSYFIGHDLVAHERGGRALADWFRRQSPTLAHCAQVHKLHHSRRKTTSADQDPFGPPYGFWLGPQELASGLDYLPMPTWCRMLFTTAFAGMAYAAFVDPFLEHSFIS